MVNTPTSATGKGGGAIEFTAASFQNAYVDIGNAFDGTKTIMFWYKAPAQNGKGIVSIGDTQNDGTPLLIFQRSTPLDQAFFSGGYRSGGLTPAVDEWHLIFITFDSSDNTFAWYYDNAVEYSAVHAETNTNASNNIYFGSGFSGLPNVTIDNAAVWLRVLTSDERDTLWNGGAGEFP